MLKIIAALLFVAYYAEGTNGPVLHGSGIVTQKVGSVTLTFNYNDEASTKYQVVNNKGQLQDFGINEKNECAMLNGQDPTGNVFGSPCSKGIDGTKNTAVITVYDVTWLSSLYITFGTEANPVVYSVIFAPDCEFPAPAQGSNAPVVAQSIPLSRFVQEQPTVPITFAVEGAETTTGLITLYKNGDPICKWTGITLDTTGSTACKNNLEKDTNNKMRVFKQEFNPPEAGKTDVYSWITTTSGNPLSITVDGTQKGESSEMDGCKAKTTTSVAPSVVVSHVIVANLALAMGLL